MQPNIHGHKDRTCRHGSQRALGTRPLLQTKSRNTSRFPNARWGPWPFVPCSPPKQWNAAPRAHGCLSTRDQGPSPQRKLGSMATCPLFPAKAMERPSAGSWLPLAPRNQGPRKPPEQSSQGQAPAGRSGRPAGAAARREAKYGNLPLISRFTSPPNQRIIHDPR